LQAGDGSIFHPAGKAGGSQIRRCRGIAVKRYGFTLGALALTPSGFCNVRVYSEAYFPMAKFIDNPIGKNFIREVVPAGRLGQPEEIGELINYLANLKGSFHTGTIIKFAGGWPAAPNRPV
jgi:3-oxoacyl-[acyl-carrier protein] reductase